MPKYVQKTKKEYHLTNQDQNEIKAEAKADQTAAAKKDTASSHTEDVLEAIDEALVGMDAQEFIAAYVQKGGQ